MVSDGELIQCDFSLNVVECGGAHTTMAAIISDNATPMPVDFDCTNLEDGNHAFKNGDMCQPKFVSCVGGVAWGMDCPDGLLFDPDQLLCERIEAIVACGGTAEPMTTEQTTTLAAEPAIKSSGYGSQSLAALPISLHRRRDHHRENVLTTAASYYQTPAAEPTTRRHIKTTKAKPITQSYYQTTTPAAEPTTKTLFSGYQTKTLAETGHRLIKTNGYETPAVKPVISRHINRHIQRVAAPKKIETSYGYQATTPAAEPTTRKTLVTMPTTRRHIQTNGGYETPAVKPVINRHINRHIQRVAAPKIEASYGYQTTPIPVPTTLAAEEQTTLLSNDYYQTPAAEPTTRRHIKKTTMAKPITQSYYQTTTPAAEPTTRRHIKTTMAKPITKSYYQTTTPAAEPTTRRHIKTTMAKPITQSYYQTTTPAAEPTTKSLFSGYQTKTFAETGRRLIKTNGGYQTPAVKPVLHPSIHRHMKTTRVAAETTPASYGYQTTTPAALLFETTTPAAEPVTESSYGGYQTDNLDAEENFAAESIARRLIKADGAYLTENFAAEPTTRSHIETNYQTPAVKPVISRHMNRHIQRVAAPKKIEASYGYQATTPAAEPTTRKTLVTMPTTRRHIQTNGGYQKTNVKSIAKQPTYYEKHFYQMSAPLEKLSGSYQTPAAEPTTRRHIEKLTTPSYGYETTTLAAEPTTRRHIEKLTTPSYGFEATTLADDVTTQSSYGGYQTTSIAEEPTTRRRFIFKKIFIDEEPTTRKPFKLQQAY
jgi:hypothetical protein